jgi:hypothetical protein
VHRVLEQVLLTGLADRGGSVRERGGQVRVLPGGQDLGQIPGQFTLPPRRRLPSVPLLDLGLRNEPDGAGEQPDRLQLRGPGQIGPGQRGQAVLDERDRVRSRDRGGRDIEEPGVAQVQRAALPADDEQPGQRLAVGRPLVTELTAGLVGHKLHQLSAVGHVPVQRRRAGPDGGGHGAHGDRGQAGLVGQRHTSRRNLRAAVLGGRPAGRARRAGPDAGQCASPNCEHRTRQDTLPIQRTLIAVLWGADS